MVPLMSLWIPILLSAVIAFVASSIIHMVLPYHKSDFSKLPKEDEVMAALRPFNIPPGDYLMPCGESMRSMKDPAFLEKWKKGPVMMATVMPSGTPSMTSSLILWFLYCIVVSIFAAYIAGRALAGCTAFVGYSLSLPQNSIWMHRKWSTTIKSMADGLLYGLLTAGTMGWLWPR